MKLTKTQRKRLETIEGNLKRAVRYLERPDIVGIATRVDNPNGGDYTVRNPECVEFFKQPEHVRPVNKHIGSDIAGLYTALDQLQAFLNPEAETI